jgi:hypothetical protein
MLPELPTIAGDDSVAQQIVDSLTTDRGWAVLAADVPEGISGMVLPHLFDTPVRPVWVRSAGSQRGEVHLMSPTDKNRPPWVIFKLEGTENDIIFTDPHQVTMITMACLVQINRERARTKQAQADASPVPESDTPAVDPAKDPNLN